MIHILIYTHDRIQKGVKEETSYLAMRRKDDTGAEMLTELVMDEQYETLFKRLFNDAHAEVMLRIPASYLTGTPTDLNPIYTEFPDFRQDRDFCLYLKMHNDFPQQYLKSVDIKILQFLIDYVCYRWLETKSPNDSQTYFGRLAKTQQDILRLISRTGTPMRRLPSFP